MSAAYTFTQFESQQTLEEHLRATTARTVLVGENVEAPRKFYSLVLTVAGGQVEIGIVAAGLGTGPAAHVFPLCDVLLIGYDTYVVGIDLLSATMLFQTETIGVFFGFAEGMSEDTAIVVHELGAVSVDSVGKERWSVMTDILGEWSTDGLDALWLRELYGPRLLKVDIRGGDVSVQENGLDG